MDITNFINYFVPHINSGNSADQSLLGYIEYSGDEGLKDFYENPVTKSIGNNEVIKYFVKE